jgi:hypothetical protein
MPPPRGFFWVLVILLSLYANAGSAVDDCKRNYEYLNSFDEVVICFDKDEREDVAKTAEFFRVKTQRRR